MPTISKQCKTKCSCLTDILVSFKTLKLMPWISKHIHIIDHDKNIDMQKLYFNVQTMNMAFNAFTMWKNYHIVLPTKTLVSLSLIPLNLLYDQFIIWRTIQIQANCSLYCVKLVPSKRSNFTKPWFNIFKVVPSFTPCLVVKYCLKLLGILHGVIMEEQD